MSEKLHDRLDSWKAIAEYLDRDTTTVMRWARERGLPVYSLPGEGQRRRAVYAYKSEIDAWLRKLPNRGTLVGQNDRDAGAAHPGVAPAGMPGETTAPLATAGSGSTSETPAPPLARPGGARQTTAASTGASEMASRPLSEEGAAPEAAGVPDPTALPSFRLRAGRRRWAVFLGGAILLAVAAAAWMKAPAPEPKVLAYEQLTNDGYEKRPGLATDGARVYFVEQSGGSCVVAGIPTSGGNPVAIAKVDRDSNVQEISPDRTELLLIQEARVKPGSIWVLSLLAGSLRRLSAIQAFSAAWSPDGRALAYATDDGLYLCDANGSDSRRIVAISGRPQGIHWSPDGRQLSVTLVPPNRPGRVWVVSRDGKGLRHLFTDSEMPYGDGDAFWTPDGRYLIFGAIYAGHGAPWVMRLSAGLLKRNGKPTCLGPAAVDFGPATLSPDLSWLYFVGTAKRHLQIDRFDARSRQFVPFLPAIHASALEFSKDGQWAAYVDDDDRLWKCRNDGSRKVQLTLPPLHVELPRWSPDGKRIAFMGQDPGQPWKVRVVSAEGGPYGPVTSNDAAEGAPTWSPDGSRLLFGGLVNPADKTSGPLILHIIDLKERRLSAVPGSEGLWTARWSPDGRYIAALTEDGRNLMLFDFRCGRWTKVLTLGPIWDLCWSRQGKSIYVNAASPEGEPALFRVRIPGHRLERLTSLKGLESGGWLGLAPDDSPLFVRALSGDEIYALECQFPK